MQQEEVREVFDKWKNAMINNDLNFLGDLFSDTFISTNTTGKTKNKNEELQWLQIRNILYRCWKDENVAINVSGANATVRSTQSLKVMLYDLPVKIDQQVDLLFISHDGKWQLQQYIEKPLES